MDSLDQFDNIKGSSFLILVLRKWDLTESNGSSMEETVDKRVNRY